MKRFRFKTDLLVNASSTEDLLNAIAGHLGDCARHLGNERPLDQVCKHFDVEEVKVDWAAEDAARIAAAEKGQPYDDGTNDLDDHVVAENGPIELNLDPKSPAGIALVEQQAREKSEREAQKAARANEGKTDAEIMAGVREREEAADPANQ
jgi:hypothetical protein